MPRLRVTCLSLLVASTVAAQQLPETLLRPAVSLSEPFSWIRGVRELNDGRLLVADQRENAVYVVDFGKGSRVQIGRNGPGPEEYDRPTGLLRAMADSTILLNSGNFRIDWLDSSGRMVRSRAYFADGWSIPRAADANGNVYWDHISSTRLQKREDPRADQAPIVRVNLAGRLDTMAYLTIRGGINPTPFPSWDDWAVTADGRVAIVRNGDEYRIDWVAVDKTMTRGPAVAWKPIQVTAADRERFLAGGPNVPRQGGSVATRADRSGGPLTTRSPRNDFPDHFPPSRLRGTWISADGRVVVHRYESLNELRPLLDVFDSAGRLTARIRLPERRQIVGFGPRGLYAVRIDEVDLQWLERYELPPGR